jgi:glycosyltransferase involved in cell wall biosynthesis
MRRAARTPRLQADMNILYVTNTLHRGGAEAHLLLLARGLKARGVHCEVAFLRSTVGGGSVDLRETFEQHGIRTHYLACERSYDLRAGVRLNRLLRSRPWHVLHSHLPRADAAAAFCKLLDRSLTWVSTLHHPYDNAYSGAPLVPLLAPMWRRADGLIAVSESVRQWAIKRLGASSLRTRTIVHGLEGDEQREPRPPGPPGWTIGSVGRYEERKGHETLIRAMPAVLKEFPEAQLKIAGHDPWGHGEVLRKIIATLGLERHVHLVGFMSDKDAFFHDIDVFAFASLSEGFGIVVLEAMDAAKPPIVSDIAPLNEIICPGTSGLVAGVNDADSFAAAILSLFRDRERLRQMGAAAQRRVAAEFSQRAMVDRTMQFYTELLASADQHEVEGGGR